MLDDGYWGRGISRPSVLLMPMSFFKNVKPLSEMISSQMPSGWSWANPAIIQKGRLTLFFLMSRYFFVLLPSVLSSIRGSMAVPFRTHIWWHTGMKWEFAEPKLLSEDTGPRRTEDFPAAWNTLPHWSSSQQPPLWRGDEPVNAQHGLSTLVSRGHLRPEIRKSVTGKGAVKGVA